MRRFNIWCALLGTMALGAVCQAFQSDGAGRGVLGQVIYSTAIHEGPDGNTRTVCRVGKDLRLVVQIQPGSYWARALLSNGTFGYLPSDAVQVFPQEYVIRRTVKYRNSYLASRGGSRGTGGVADPGREEVVASESQNFLGTPYKWGGNDLKNGIDCSGLVKKLYGEVGVDLPRTAAEQSLVGQPITRLEYLQPGDRLYFWDAKKGKVGHTGIYVGGGYFVHASSGHHQVAREYLGQPKWLRILVQARR